MKHLGMMNGWYPPRVWNNDAKVWESQRDREPPEYRDCRNAKHPLKEVGIGRCLHRYTCEICQVSWDVDSSD